MVEKKGTRALCQLLVSVFILLFPFSASAQPTNTVDQNCDALAASPYDASREQTVPGVEASKIDARRAEAACQLAVQAHPSARLFYQLGRALAAGKKFGEALAWYHKAADQGSIIAKTAIGGLYDNGHGAKKDYVEAVYWYRMAADQGEVVAEFAMGSFYETGQGVEQDYVQAMQWYRKAANQGYASAQCNIGILYNTGHGVPLDYAEAARWYRMAADQGNADAATYLGLLYANGRGVQQDRAEAQQWFGKAAAQGSTRAKALILEQAFASKGAAAAGSGALQPDTEPMLRFETEAHAGAIVGLATDSAQRIMVTAAADKTARIWSLPDLHQLGVLRPPSGPGLEGFLNAVAVSADGRQAAVAGWIGPEHGSKDVLLFDLQTQRVTRRIEGLPGAVAALAFSPDGTQLAVGGENRIRIWHVPDGQLLHEFTDESWLAEDLSFSPDGTLAALLRLQGGGNTISLYDEAGRFSRIVPIAPKNPSQIRFSPNGRFLVVGYQSGAYAEVRDSKTLKLTAALSVSDLSGISLDSVAWSPDSATVYAGGVLHTGDFVTAAWAESGAGARTIVYRGKAAAEIEALADGVLVVADRLGDVGLTDSHGRSVSERRNPAIDMAPNDERGDTTRQLRLSDDGSLVEWTTGEAPNRWLNFDARKLNLTTVAAMTPNLIGSSPSEAKWHVTDWYKQTTPKLNGVPLTDLPFENSHSVDIKGGLILLGMTHGIYLLKPDPEGAPYRHPARSQWLHPPTTPEGVWRVTMSVNHLLAVAALGDGTLRWYRLRDGKELLAVLITRDASRWVAFTPSGYYAASPGGEDLFGWVINRGRDNAADFFPASRFRDRFYRPDVVRLVLQTLDEDAALRQANAASDRNEPKATPATIAALLPPVLDLVSAPARFATDHVTIQYRVRTPPDAPMIGDPRVKVNGEWQPKSRAATQVTADGTRDLVIGPLPPRDSTVNIYADNRNARSVPLTLALKWNGAAVLAPGQQGPEAEHKPHLFVLAVGISDYQRPDLRLNFAEHDAEQFVVAMQAQRSKRYADVTTRLLRDGEATLENVKGGLAWLASRTATDDVGVLFLAGHGVQTPDQSYYFAPFDFDPANQRKTGVDYRAIRSALDAFSTAGNKALFLVDTCYAGGALGPNLVASNGAALVAALSRPDYGVVVLSASKGDQLSYEDPQWHDGAFTSALLEGIVQAKADAADSGEITLLNLGGYVTQRVRVLTNRRQEPMLIIPGGGMVDFVIALH